MTKHHHARARFVLPLRVYYEDTDAAGVVYYANYLRFVERARTEWLRSLGVSQRTLQANDGVQFVVSGFTVEYREPARLDDQLTLEMDIVAARRASFVLAQRAVDAATNRVLVSAKTTIAAIRCTTGRPVGMPEWLLSRVKP